MLSHSHITLLVYEYSKTPEKPAKFIKVSYLTGKDHYEKSRMASYIDK